MIVDDQVIRFRSGAQSPAILRGLVWARQAVGVDIALTSGPVLEQLADYANDGGKVFVDSGAFTAFRKFMRAPYRFVKGVPVAIGPVADFPRVFAKYARLVELVRPECRGNVHMVAPDVIGHQDLSIDVLKRWAPQVQELIAQGVQVLVPLQCGAVTVSFVYRRACEILGTDRFISSIPSKAAAMGEAETLEFVRSSQPRALHLLGKVDGIEERIERCRAARPDVRITCDGNTVRAMVGKGRPVTEYRRRWLQRHPAAAGSAGTSVAVCAVFGGTVPAAAARALKMEG